MARAAAAFLAALSPAERRLALAPLEAEARESWHYVPGVRRGIPLKRLLPAQRQAALALLKAALSDRGYWKATVVMSLETILRELEGSSIRDPDLYYFAVFGQPGPEKTWGWRVEGHHLSLNFTIVDGQRVATVPAFFGANPAEVKRGPRRGLRALEREETLARALLQSLTDSQRRTAVLPVRAPQDLITGAQRRVSPFPPEGLSVSDMTPDQQKQLLALVDEYLGNMPAPIASAEWDRIRAADVGKIRFAWAGGALHREPHYYRIQGPSFLIEYDNTQNGGNHIHSVWRGFDRDFGRDLLGEHYRADHHGAAPH